jgi:ATP phosphoribosyltransferase
MHTLSITIGAIALTSGLVALETPQTPDINYETLQIEKTVAELQANHIQGQKLLGKSSARLDSLNQELKAKIAQLEKSIKAKVPQADLEKIKQALKNLREKISAELAKLK